MAELSRFDKSAVERARTVHADVQAMDVGKATDRELVMMLSRLEYTVEALLRILDDCVASAGGDLS